MTGPPIAGAPLPTAQAMLRLVAQTGVFPSPAGPPEFTLGMVHSFAGSFAAFGALVPTGQGLGIKLFTPLYSIYGDRFGGDRATFALPELVETVAIGGNLGVRGNGTLGMTWLIAAVPGGEAPMAGMIVLFGGPFAPGGWLIADGSMLPIGQYPALFAAIGTTFGGDGKINFALPNLTGLTPVGIGTGPGGGTVVLGQPVPGAIPGLGLAWLICVAGLYPENGGGGAFPANQPYLGQILAYAGNDIPPGWALCDGLLLPIAGNASLYNILGTTYGGDGVNNFALPNLSGLMIEGKAG